MPAVTDRTDVRKVIGKIPANRLTKAARVYRHPWVIGHKHASVTHMRSHRSLSIHTLDGLSYIHNLWCEKLCAFLSAFDRLFLIRKTRFASVWNAGGSKKSSIHWSAGHVKSNRNRTFLNINTRIPEKNKIENAIEPQHRITANSLDGQPICQGRCRICITHTHHICIEICIVCVY